MDELTPENEPIPDLMPPQEPRSGCLLKTIGLLVIIGILIGAAIFFGLEAFKKYSSRSENIPAPVPVATPIPIPTPTPEPPALSLARQLLMADSVARKNLVTQIVAATGSKSEAISYLADAFAASQPDVQTDVVSVFGLLAKSNPEALSPLISALDFPTVRREAILALGSLGATAKPAVPKLKKIAANKKEKKTIRNAAGKALTQIQGKPHAKARGKRRG